MREADLGGRAKDASIAPLKRVLQAEINAVPETPQESFRKPEVLDGLITVAVAKGADLEPSKKEESPTADDYKEARKAVKQFKKSSEADDVQSPPLFDEVSTALKAREVNLLRDELVGDPNKSKLAKAIDAVVDSHWVTKATMTAAGFQAEVTTVHIAAGNIPGALMSGAMGIGCVAGGVVKEIDHRKDLRKKREAHEGEILNRITKLEGKE